MTDPQTVRVRFRIGTEITVYDDVVRIDEDPDGAPPGHVLFVREGGERLLVLRENWVRD